MNKNIILTDLRNNSVTDIGEEISKFNNADGGFSIKTDKGFILKFKGDQD